MPINKVCVVCGKEFSVPPCRDDVAKFCSPQCKVAGLKGKQRLSKGRRHTQWLTIYCLNCSKSIELSPFWAKRQKFCSTKCSAQYHRANKPAHNRVKRVVIKCATCKKDFEVTPKNAESVHYCSIKCFREGYKHPVGINHHAYKKIAIRCEVCGQEFLINRGRIKRARFCSPECRGAYSSRKIAGMHGPTDIEKLLADELDKHGIEYKFQYIVGRWVVDIALPQFRVIIEADGKYWHDLPGRQERDAKKTRVLKSGGWKIFRFSGDAIHKSPSHCIKKVLSHIKSLTTQAT